MQSGIYTAVYGDNAQNLSGTVYWMLQDGQESTRQLLNNGGTVTDSYTTDAYGNSISSSGSAANPFKWNGGSGYYSDGESGLQKVGARYYDPSVGRFISQDSLLIAGEPSDSQAINRYNYCEGNPVGRLDPDGHGGLLVIVVVVAVVAVVWLVHKFIDWDTTPPSDAGAPPAQGDSGASEPSSPSDIWSASSGLPYGYMLPPSTDPKAPAAYGAWGNQPMYKAPEAAPAVKE